jgi:hypothetical protein
MSTALAVMLVFDTALAYATLVFILPSCARSQFRLKLWALRDQVVDEIFAGCFEDTRQPRKFVAAVESVVGSAEHLSLLRVWLEDLASDEPGPPEHLRVDLATLSAPDRERLTRHVELFHRLIIRHALVGSVSGWLFLLVTKPLAFLGILRRAVAPRAVKASSPFEDVALDEMSLNGRNGVHIEPALKALSQRARATHDSRVTRS